VGWFYTAATTAGFSSRYNWDIWRYFGGTCNYGSGVNVLIGIDSWQAAVNGSSWVGQNNLWRPASYHCHCPWSPGGDQS